ncbi:killer cell lectin-like receptor subfamily B member 1F [Chlamydotis macqueenii]
MARGQERVVALTTVYSSPAVARRSARGGCGKRPGRRWYWALLGAGWVGTAVLAGVALWLLQQRGGTRPALSQCAEISAAACSRESCPATACQRDVPESQRSLCCFRLQLRQQLCEQGNHSTAGSSACRLCPAGWQPFAAKCYRVSAKTSAWEAAAGACQAKRAQLVVLESAEEKVFIAELTGNASRVWTGLRMNETRGKGWTWRDGAPLQEALFPVRGVVGQDACAAIWKGELNSHACSAPLHWVCQKNATEI